MKKLNNKKLNKVYNAISNYDSQNRGFVFDVSSLMKYCVEYDLKEILKENLGIIDEPLMDQIFKSLNFNITVNFIQDSKNKNNNRIKCNMEYSDPNTFKENYIKNAI